MPRDPLQPSVFTGWRPWALDHADQFAGEPVWMVDQRREALGTDVGFISGKPEDDHRKVFFRPTATETRNSLRIHAPRGYFG